MREPPAEREQSIERGAREAIVRRVAPREGTVEATEHLARLAVRVLVRAAFVAGGTALAFGEVRDGVGRGALELIGEVSIVHLDLLDDRAELTDEIDRNGVGNEHRILLFWSTP